MTKEEALKILQRIKDSWLDVHYPLKHCMFNMEHTVGEMFEKALEVLNNE